MTGRGDWFVAIELHVFLSARGTSTTYGQAFTAPGPAALESARRRGLRTAVAARHRDYYSTDLDGLVDAWLICDTRDPVAVARAVAGLSGQAAVVHSFVDTFVGTAAAVNRLLGLRGADPLAPGLARNKATARAALERAGLDPVRYGTAAVDSDDLRSPIGYPCIAKPVDGAASWDVRLVHRDADVVDLAKSHANRDYGRGVRQRGELIFEEYLEGPLWSVEGWVSDGTVEIFGWTDRVQAAPPDFAELSFGFAADPPCDDARAWAERTLRALGYDFGPFHLEAIMTDHGLRLLELNPRLVGCGAHPCVSLATGVDVVDHVVGRLLGEQVLPIGATSAATAHLVVSSQTGVLVDVRGTEALTAQPGFVGALLTVSPGAVLDGGLSSNAAHIGYVIAVGKDRPQANHRARLAAEGMDLVVDTSMTAVGS
jgi:biotin carboxylase